MDLKKNQQVKLGSQIPYTSSSYALIVAAKILGYKVYYPAIPANFQPQIAKKSVRIVIICSDSNIGDFLEPIVHPDQWKSRLV